MYWNGISKVQYWKKYIPKLVNNLDCNSGIPNIGSSKVHYWKRYPNIIYCNSGIPDIGYLDNQNHSLIYDR